jgi:hypothetical protein
VVRWLISLILLVAVSCPGGWVTGACAAEGQSMAEEARARQEWQSCRERQRSPGHLVRWSVTVDEISMFGGLYGKAHLRGSDSNRVHILWDPETIPAASVRSTIKEGATLLLIGRFVGVSPEGEVIVKVSEE